MHILPIGVVSPIIYCNLFLLIIISRIVFKTPITWQKIVAVCGAVIGIAMVVNIFGSAGRLNLIGVAWALAAMASWASLVTFEKYLLIHEVDGNAILAYEGVFSLIFISVFIQSPWGCFREHCSVFYSQRRYGDLAHISLWLSYHSVVLLALY